MEQVGDCNSLVHDALGPLPVAILRTTTKRVQFGVVVPTAEDAVVLSAHRTNRKVPNSETRMFLRWLREEGSGPEPCDFCEAPSMHQANRFCLRPYVDEDMQGAVPLPKPQFTVDVSSYVCCDATACRYILQKKVVEMGRRHERAGHASYRVPIDLQSCALCGSTANDVVRLRKCASCQIVAYCSEKCQRADWKAGHKKTCQAAPAD